MRVLGVDGCKAGWVTIALEDGRFAGAGVAASFADVVTRLAVGARAIGVDMPIGLLDNRSPERSADVAARAGLPAGARASVFAVPPRPVVEASTWERALAKAQQLTGKGISKQSFHLFAKILEVDAFVSLRRLHEVHPEVSFRRLAEVHPTIAAADGLARKKSWKGQRQRMELLAAAGIRLPIELGDADHVAPDDVLDAAIAAWSAARIAARRALAYPARPNERDRSGRLLVIKA